jgi:hypothetical protein
MPTTAEGQEQATVARSQPRRNVQQNRIRKYKQKKLDWVKKTEVQTVSVYERKRKNSHRERKVNKMQKKLYLSHPGNNSAQITPSPIRKLPINRGPPEPD